MRISPFQLSQELKEVLCTYLETSYRISNRTVTEERAALLRRQGVISQSPFIETTPRFQYGQWLENINSPWIPQQLPHLTRFGMPTDKFPLWVHQENSLQAAWDEMGRPRNLIVASGTGSGKTECFYLPILADILREALTWPSVGRGGGVGEWSGGQWLHGRRYEQRPAAMRAIVLYPMNALVNDQLRRLRRTLASDDAIRWQKQNLHGNLIHFGRYTSQTELPGHPDSVHRRQRWNAYIGGVQQSWDTISDKLKRSGNWPRPDGPEMICRWDIQAAPPDVLITNYAMLEYMLVRPIEAQIFAQTRHWLAASDTHILTLVLDEAHTYSGARGTEVAYLIQRLFERLDVSPKQVRCIATSASLGETEEALQRVQAFVADLFGHPNERFSVIQAQLEEWQEERNLATEQELEVFAKFQHRLESSDSAYASEEARMEAGVYALLDALGDISEGQDGSERLYKALRDHPRVWDLLELTARKAKELNDVATKIWGSLGNEGTRAAATAGLLAAGAYARPTGLRDMDVPPLLPSRLHLMFRGIPGLWACINPNCSMVPSNDGQRSIGKLYAEPRIWCDCGARVLEVFSCRVCGLLFLGGIFDQSGSRLWPYEKGLESGFQDYDRYYVIAVENPGTPSAGQRAWAEELRSIYTTAVASGDDPKSIRMVWVDPESGNNSGTEAEGGYRPHRCPRCNAQRSPSRHVIEPLRSTGPQSLATLVEHAFRTQPPRNDGEDEQEEKLAGGSSSASWFTITVAEEQRAEPPKGNPNQGRKALVFSDGRQAAAMLAGSLTYLHARDLFRQLLLLVMDEFKNETGRVDLPVPELRGRLMKAAVKRGVDPSFGEVDAFWTQYEDNVQHALDLAKPIVDVYLRREVADREVGVEALGLARWLPNTQGNNLMEQIPPLSPLDRAETTALLFAIMRILAGENVLLPDNRDPNAWNSDLVKDWQQRLVVYPPATDRYGFTWEPGRNNRLIRYLEAVVQRRSISGGVPYLMQNLWENYLRGPVLASTVGNRPGWGIPLTRLALAPIEGKIYVCEACGYLSTDTIADVCLRCHGTCHVMNVDVGIQEKRNYYRHLANLAILDSRYPDPFPLRVLEHTAQISATDAAKRERHFQDQFIRSGDHQENRHANRVDILSVTTTMEMGIDIGDLTTVALHNMPPTVANYQQRAGRAGRRSDDVAVVLTYARDRNHDQYYYSRVAEIVSGPVRVPEVHLDNKVIARRHVHALTLQMYFGEEEHIDAGSNLFAAFGSIGSFVDGDPSRYVRFCQYVSAGASRQRLHERAERIAPLWVEETGDWLDLLPDNLWSSIENVPADRDLLDTLITKGLLPRYAFPVDLVALWTQEPHWYNRDSEVQRDLQIALSEYAPDAEIIIDGKIYRSVGLYKPFEDDPKYLPDQWVYECPECRNIDVMSFSSQQPTWQRCSVCQEPITGLGTRRIVPAIQPDGFRTDWRTPPEKYRGGGRERAGFTSLAQLHAGETARSGESHFERRLWVHQRTGDLYMMNKGPMDRPVEEEPGFWICPQCGRSLEEPNQRHFSPGGGRCSGRPRNRSILMHQFQSDVALMTVALPPHLDARSTEPSGRAAWLSLGTALLRAAATHLQIDESELAIGMRPLRSVDGRLLGEVFLYDTLPNGAGYAKEVAAEIEVILKRAYQLCVRCPGQCESVCYRCLLDYNNQYHHALLDRHLAQDLLAFVLWGQEPVLVDEAGRRALAYLSHFAQAGYALDDSQIPGILELPSRRWAILPIHPLYSSQHPELQALQQRHGTSSAAFTSFDLSKRPFWVWNELLNGQRGRL